MLTNEAGIYHFQWKDLGDIVAGRPNLGSTTHVAVYRLMQYTLREVLCGRYGAAAASEILREAGTLAGMEFCKNVLDVGADFNAFVAQLQEQLRVLSVGILRIERADLQKMDLVMTVSEDLDCSGLPLFDDTVCEYDEGFIAGVFQVYTGKKFLVREVDCWASGDRTCRFTARVAE
jgi:uncharacterized protein